MPSLRWTVLRALSAEKQFVKTGQDPSTSTDFRGRNSYARTTSAATPLGELLSTVVLIQRRLPSPGFCNRTAQTGLDSESWTR